MMRNFFLLTLLLGSIISKGQNSSLKGFQFIDDFERNRSTFINDFFSFDRASDSGTVITYNSVNRDYIVVQAELFLKTGRIESTYWLDKNNGAILLAKYARLTYDATWDQATKAKGGLQYLVYASDGCKRYDAQRNEIDDNQNNEIKIEIESFFKDATKNIKLIK